MRISKYWSATQKFLYSSYVRAQRYRPLVFLRDKDQEDTATWEIAEIRPIRRENCKNEEARKSRHILVVEKVPERPMLILSQTSSGTIHSELDEKENILNPEIG